MKGRWWWLWVVFAILAAIGILWEPVHALLFMPPPTPMDALGGVNLSESNTQALLRDRFIAWAVTITVVYALGWAIGKVYRGFRDR
jgi:predicted membrane protein